MIHYLPGQIGHTGIIVSFITALLAAYAFLAYDKTNDIYWKKIAVVSFYIHGAAIIVFIASLYHIISQHLFEYHYAWSHSSLLLPIYYQISCFWEGQEGSFMLWIFWNFLIAIILFYFQPSWRNVVLAVILLSQVVLLSMILGLDMWGVKIGSSPFILLRDATEAPIFQLNPDFVPKDGNGLNPLLQNYWMVIHPPTLFLGFALSVVPFGFAVAGLWKKNYEGWIEPALSWNLLATLILGIGILMGAYWAYETLNFGGYWNWDPVENAVYVPWLVMVGTIHLMMMHKKATVSLKSIFLLSAGAFLLVLYSTFLTRSGVLGNASVHSFTDAGLSFQLILLLAVFTVLFMVLFFNRWKNIPSSPKQLSWRDRSFWIYAGVAVLCFMSLQVIIPTSIPVWNSMLAWFGQSSQLAPPVDQVGFYTRYQLWFTVILLFLTGLGQWFWWNVLPHENGRQRITSPILITLLILTVWIIIGKIHEPAYLLVLVSAVFALVVNLSFFIRVTKQNKWNGGSFTHLGVAVMIIGILYSAGYNKILSMNYTGLVWSNDFPDEVNTNNLLLFRQEPREMNEWILTYKKSVKKTKEAGYIDESFLIQTSDPQVYILADTWNTLKMGDTVFVENPENSYFEIQAEKEGDIHTLYPRVQISSKNDMMVYSPDIKHTITADIYTHVRTFPDPKQPANWSEWENFSIKPDSVFFIQDHPAQIKSVEPLSQINGVNLTTKDFAAQIHILVQSPMGETYLKPIFIIKDGMAGRLAYENKDLGVKLMVLAINPTENTFELALSTTQKDWVIIESLEKPGINFLWLGAMMVFVGLGITFYHRVKGYQVKTK